MLILKSVDKRKLCRLMMIKHVVCVRPLTIAALCHCVKLGKKGVNPTNTMCQCVLHVVLK